MALLPLFITSSLAVALFVVGPCRAQFDLSGLLGSVGQLTGGGGGGGGFNLGGLLGGGGAGGGQPPVAQSNDPGPQHAPPAPAGRWPRPPARPRPPPPFVNQRRRPAGRKNFGEKRLSKPPPPPPPQRRPSGPRGMLGSLFGAGGAGLGGTVEGILQGVGLGGQFSHQIGGLINGVAAQYFAPNPHSSVPPHVQRRIMRYCSRHPNDPKCLQHPEFNVGGNVPGAPNVGATLDVNEIFPTLVNVQIPPIPTLNLRNVLEGVPQMLHQFLPPETVGQITAVTRNAIESMCASGNCRQQKPEWLNQRASIAEYEANIIRTIEPGKAQNQIDRDIEVRLARTFQVKQALIRKAGLQGKIEPANDGAFQQDILLTEPQANALINEINQNKVGVAAIPGGGRRKRAGNAMFLENMPNQRWPSGSPIPYTFAPSVPESDRGSVRAALQEIESKSCLSFSETPTKPSGSHLYYVKISNAAVCGYSYIGRYEPGNPIYLSFQCGNPVGVAIHETMHALGVDHEATRVDRDVFISVNWANVNPQNYDTFARTSVVKFTSYGLQYDYGSIMHYGPRQGAKSTGLSTMTAKVNPGTNNQRMGQRQGLSATDVEVLKRMYCKQTCVDSNVYCGVWATNKLCTLASTRPWMGQNCRKSCSLC